MYLWHNILCKTMNILQSRYNILQNRYNLFFQFNYPLLWGTNIPGIPTTLTGHIVPAMTIASLFGICILCKACCQVIFDDDKCQVIYNGNIILTGYKDSVSDLCTLPIFPNKSRTALDATHQPLPGPCLDSAPQPTLHGINFSYHCTTKENNVNSCTKACATHPRHPY